MAKVIFRQEGLAKVVFLHPCLRRQAGPVETAPLLDLVFQKRGEVPFSYSLLYLLLVVEGDIGDDDAGKPLQFLVTRIGDRSRRAELFFPDEGLLVSFRFLGRRNQLLSPCSSSRAGEAGEVPLVSLPAMSLATLSTRESRRWCFSM